MQQKDQYIYKNGRYIKISGGKADVQIVTELPANPVEGTIYLVEDQEPINTIYKHTIDMSIDNIARVFLTIYSRNENPASTVADVKAMLNKLEYVNVSGKYINNNVIGDAVAAINHPDELTCLVFYPDFGFSLVSKSLDDADVFDSVTKL